MPLFLRRLLFHAIKNFCALCPTLILRRIIPYDGALIRSSYQELRKRADEYSEVFYKFFWEDYPETRQLFGKNMPRKELDVRINHLMVFLSENADNPYVFVNFIQHLAKRHITYGVYKHQFQYVSNTNIKTMKYLLQRELSKEEEAAWRQGFYFIQKMMCLRENFKQK